MKQYRRDAKQHMDNEEYAKWRSSRDKKVCRGGKPHDYILVAPYGFKKVDQPFGFLDTEQIVECYKSQEKVNEFLRKEEERLKALGIEHKYTGWRYQVTKRYICSVCKKQKYEYGE